MVLCHGFPTDELGAAAIGVTMPMLADRIANEGWRALAFTFRGCGRSTGNFSLGGWLDDLTAAIAWLSDIEPTRGVWLAGFGTGGALSVCAGARLPQIVGVASLCAPADFDDWANHPRRLLQHARDIRAIADADFPTVPEAWIRELREIRPVTEVERLAPRPLLLVHGSEDQSVPSLRRPGRRRRARLRRAADRVGGRRTTCATIPEPSPSCWGGSTGSVTGPSRRRLGGSAA